MSTRPHRQPLSQQQIIELLTRHDIQPTLQRLEIAQALFARDMHLSADDVLKLVNQDSPRVSKATVYNTLHQFVQVGLLRQVAVDGSKTYFDTNASEHHHFFVEGANELVDIPGADVIVDKMPVAPEGYEIARIDVVVRLKKSDRRR